MIGNGDPLAEEGGPEQDVAWDESDAVEGEPEMASDARGLVIQTDLVVGGNENISIINVICCGDYYCRNTNYVGGSPWLWPLNKMSIISIYICYPPQNLGLLQKNKVYIIII